MKRTALKAKKRTLKRTPLRRKSKTPLAKAKIKLWELCKQITRERYGNVCYTCGKGNLEGFHQQTGHGPWPKAVLPAKLKYDLRVLRIQCAACNQFRGGMGAEFYKRMVEEEGQEYVDRLEKERQNIEKVGLEYYEQLIEEYTEILNSL